MHSLNANASCINDSQIEVSGDFDGANPRSKESIIKEKSNRFRLKPFNEQGSSVSYYFRFNTKVVNNSTEYQNVEMIIEWPPLENYSEKDQVYDTYWYGDIGNWKWTYASIDGIEAKINIYVPPGTTYVGFFPRYSYEYFDRFISELEESDELTKWVEIKSSYGKNIWHLRITDSSIPDGKKNTILITSRNHPYETGCSYATEEMIRFLLSEDPRAQKLKKENIIYLIPMLNPDGVELGMAQRTGPEGVNISYGVGTNDPAVTSLLSTVEKIKPKIWADIHSWPHKIDDGLYTTHEWVAEGLLREIPDGTFNDYVWNVSFVKVRNPAPNHLWQWLLRSSDSAGVSLSYSWYRRNEEDLRRIGVETIIALCKIARNP